MCWLSTYGHFCGTTPYSRLLGEAWGVGMRLHVINGAFLSSPHFISLSTQTEGEASEWGYTVPRYLSYIMVSITLTVWGGSWAGGTESVMWITRDWVGHIEIHQLKKCRKVCLSSNDFIIARIFLDQKVWDASLVLHGQWKGACFTIILSNEEAVIWDVFESLFCSLPWDPAVVPCLSLQFSWKSNLKYVSRFLWVGEGSCRTVNMVTPTNTTAWSTERDSTL